MTRKIHTRQDRPASPTPHSRSHPPPYQKPPPPPSPQSMSIIRPALNTTTTTTTIAAKAAATTISPKVTATGPHNLLVCSLGNPAPYTHTLHSAGHHLLSALRTHLSYPPFHPTSSRDGYAKGLISRGQDALLWQSPTYMNVSGPAVLSAWRTFIREAQTSSISSLSNIEGGGAVAAGQPRLAILHDELELELGKIKVRKGPGGSMKGHNGLKSIAGMGSAVGGGKGGAGWWRIGVGIGRPDSRERGDVSDYVLRKMKPAELERIQGAAGEVMEELVKLRDG